MDKHDRSPLKNISLANPWHLIAVGFGSGIFPKAPGTFGSLAALPLCMILIYQSLTVQLIVIAATFLIGWYASSVTEKAMGMHDNSSIVIDEFLGMFVSCFAFPQSWYFAFVAFVLFRIFDILNPFPVSYADKQIGGALGVMLDDLLAGIYALLCAQLMFFGGVFGNF